jgi:acyl-CoA synthetase (AMP-forming)/AMP-acid ligase II
MWAVFKFTEGSQAKNLALLPMFHIYGLNGLLNLALLRGHHVITLPRFEPQTFVKTMKTFKVKEWLI